MGKKHQVVKEIEPAVAGAARKSAGLEANKVCLELLVTLTIAGKIKIQLQVYNR